MTLWQRIRAWLLDTPAQPELELVSANEPQADGRVLVDLPHDLLLALLPSGRIVVGTVIEGGGGFGRDIEHRFVEAGSGLEHPVDDLDSFLLTASPWTEED